MGSAFTRNRELIVASARKWRAPQRRYREILVEVRQQLGGRAAGRPLRSAYGLIRTLRRAGPEFLDREAINNTREDARAIIATIERLHKSLSSSTMTPELRLRLGLEVAPAHADNSPGLRLLGALEEVRQLCEAAVVNQPRPDQVMIWCARIAHSLMHRYSDEKPTSGSARSTYRVLTGLLYEVMTGEAGHDLKRACEDHLRVMRSV